MLTSNVKNAIQNSKSWVLATAGETPNVVTIMFHEMDDQDNLIFYQVFMNKTIDNIKAGSSVAILVNPEGSMEGYQIKGTATYSTDAALVQKGNAMASPMGLTVTGAVIVSPQEVYVLTPGPDNGKRL